MISAPSLTQLADLLVVKIGGGAGISHTAIVDDLAQLAITRPIVVVHGVSDALNQLCAMRGVPVQTLTSPEGHSSRYTNAAVRDLYVEAAESINRALVADLRARDISACGMVGEDTVIRGQRKTALRAVVNGRVRVVRDDYSGSIAQVDVERLQAILSEGAIPVVPPLATSDEGLLNVDGDRIGAAIAGALGARDLVILSNVRGLYRQPDDAQSLVRVIQRDQLGQAMRWAQGRMKRKVLGAEEALNGGVRRVIIADARAHQPLLAALGGEGTIFTS